MGKSIGQRYPYAQAPEKDSPFISKALGQGSSGSGRDKVVDLYRHYSDNPEMQAQLCEASTWEDIENFTKKLTPGESGVALSYLERWRGKSN